MDYFFSATHLHLMLNHVPVLGTIFVFILLVWGWCGDPARSRRWASSSP